MVHIAVFGDAHVPSCADEIPEWVCEKATRADHVIHTGDFDSADRETMFILDIAEGTLDVTHHEG